MTEFDVSSDPFDPNTWAPPWEGRIYATNSEDNEYARVDAEDYAWFVKWKWHINKPHPRRAGKKRYMVRNTSNGERWGPKLYLHVEIAKRAGMEPLSPKHSVVDHKDGDEFNCLRDNLEYVTQAENIRRSIAKARRKWRSYSHV